MAAAVRHPVAEARALMTVEAETWDVVVVGAGPAGSTAAWSLGRAGCSVLLLDREAFPRWKVCGGCLGPTALGLLDAMGLGEDVRSGGAPALGAMELRALGSVARIPLGDSVALSRARLDQMLVSAAEEVGVRFRGEAHVTAVASDGDGLATTVRTGGGEAVVRAPVVVDATGLGRGLAMDGARAEEAVHPEARIGVGAVFSAPPDDLPEGEVRMTVDGDGYVGMVQTEDGRLTVAAALAPAAVAEGGPGGAVRALLERAGARLPDGEPEAGWRGTPALTRSSEEPSRPRLFRVGDAAGYVEPFTGEGMGWAVSSGLVLTRYVQDALDGRLDEAAVGWARSHARIAARRQRTCRLLASGLRRPRLVRAVVRLLGAAPFLAEPLVGLTGGIPAELQGPDSVLARTGSAGAPPTAPVGGRA